MTPPFVLAGAVAAHTTCPALAQKLKDERAANTAQIIAKDQALQEKLKG